MRSARPKVLHTIAGRTLLEHVLSAIGEADIAAIALVIGPGQDEVAAAA
jgi:bifunctional UDP-N-acetylglucosamine pyrophosphorylase/glucosamine-1-phosphate N-acetyltransferase